MWADAIIFDFDGVLIESELEGNVALAGLLTGMGHPISPQEAVQHFTGLSGQDFIAALEARIGRALPSDFHLQTRALRDRALRDGIDAVEGAVEFVRWLPTDLPRAVASSSSTRWIRAHLAHLGLEDSFEPHIYSGAEHVARGKPAPDLYLLAAQKLGVDIGRSVIIEDSQIGAKGALASGAHVIGLAAGLHCFDGHDEMLRDAGISLVAKSFGEVRSLLMGDQLNR